MNVRIAGVVVALTAVATPAAAQKPVVEGPGYQLTEGTVVHPMFGAETGIVSGVFYAGGRTSPVYRLYGGLAIASQGNKPRGEEKLLIRDGDSDQEARPAPALDFRLAGDVHWEDYLTTDREIGNQRNLSYGLDGQVTTSPKGPLSFFAEDRLARTFDPRNFESAEKRGRIVNIFEGGVRVQPRTRPLRFALKYRHTVDRFDNPDTRHANRLQNLGRGRAEWQFLPLSRLYLDASIGYFGALNNANAALIKRRSKPFRAELGVASAITEAVTVRGHIGYGRGNYQAEQEGEIVHDFSGLLFGAEIGMRYSPLGRWTLAYEHDFEDSVQANFYRDHAVIFRLDRRVDLMVLDLGAELRLRRYAGIPLLIGAPIRDDVIFRTFGKIRYPFRDWVAFTAEIELESDQTSYTANVINGSGSSYDPSYTRLVLQIGAVTAF